MTTRTELRGVEEAARLRARNSLHLALTRILDLPITRERAAELLYLARVAFGGSYRADAAPQPQAPDAGRA